MKRVMIAVLCGILVSALALAVTAKQVPDKATIDGCKKKKPAVVLDHKLHVDAKIACTECHHEHKALKAGDAVEVKKCSACHLKPEKADTPVCTVASKKKNAYHLQCVGCHVKEKQKNPKLVVTGKCVECHKKK